MGLSPMTPGSWIETDTSWQVYHKHKMAQRGRLGDRVYRSEPESEAAQQEITSRLLQDLTAAPDPVFRVASETLEFIPSGQKLPLTGPETLWNASLWVADDLVIMAPGEQGYRLVAASLCSPSDWCLEEKFGRPLAEIHQPIPGFDRALTPKVDRFLDHLRVAHPVVRFNWSVQAGDQLCRRPNDSAEISNDSPLHYRCERQTLSRLPATGTVLFTIRVYLHPLEHLISADALRPLLWAIDTTPPKLQKYKGFDRLAPALERYRRLADTPNETG